MDIQQLKRQILNRSRRFGPALVVAVISSGIGLYTLGQSGAATFAAAAEAEIGAVAGNAGAGDPIGASSDASVRFGITPTPPSPVPAPTCNLNATTANFSSQVVAAAPGQTICLASGNYGTWTGVNKAVTIRAAAGATPTMQVSFGAGTNGFSLDHIGGLGGVIRDATNITIRNSTFTSTIDFDGGTNTRSVVLSHNNILWPATSGGPNAKVIINESATPTAGTLANPAVIVEYNDIQNGDLDGVHIGDGSGIIVRNNRFVNLCDAGVNHTDNIQFEGGSAVQISGNYIYAPRTCDTQGITSFDSGTNGVIIENNVVDIPRDWEIELYSDKNSIIRHNTVVWHAAPYSGFGHATGIIDLENKSADPPGSGTQIYDNNAYVSFVAPTTGTAHHNTDPSTVRFTGSGSTSASSHDDFLLAAGSPGKGSASDGTDTGIFAIGNTTYGPLP